MKAFVRSEKLRKLLKKTEEAYQTYQSLAAKFNKLDAEELLDFTDAAFNRDPVTGEYKFTPKNVLGVDARVLNAVKEPVTNLPLSRHMMAYITSFPGVISCGMDSAHYNKKALQQLRLGVRFNRGTPWHEQLGILAFTPYIRANEAGFKVVAFAGSAISGEILFNDHEANVVELKVANSPEEVLKVLTGQVKPKVDRVEKKSCKTLFEALAYVCENYAFDTSKAPLRQFPDKLMELYGLKQKEEPKPVSEPLPVGQPNGENVVSQQEAVKKATTVAEVFSNFTGGAATAPVTLPVTGATTTMSTTNTTFTADTGTGVSIPGSSVTVSGDSSTGTATS